MLCLNLEVYFTKVYDAKASSTSIPQQVFLIGQRAFIKRFHSESFKGLERFAIHLPS